MSGTDGDLSWWVHCGTAGDIEYHTFSCVCPIPEDQPICSTGLECWVWNVLCTTPKSVVLIHGSLIYLVVQVGGKCISFHIFWKVGSWKTYWRNSTRELTWGV